MHTLAVVWCTCNLARLVVVVMRACARRQHPRSGDAGHGAWINRLPDCCATASVVQGYVVLHVHAERLVCSVRHTAGGLARRGTLLQDVSVA